MLNKASKRPETAVNASYAQGYPQYGIRDFFSDHKTYIWTDFGTQKIKQAFKVL